MPNSSVLHFVFEALAYLVGFELYRRARRGSGDFLAASDRNTIVVAAVLGAALGSKLLFWLEDPAETLAHIADPVYLMGGKTIVGALIAGTAAVEFVKRRIGVDSRTGDLFAVPLAVGIAIGRLGCFAAGLSDRTYGVATTLPWGVDFGDGIARHPTQMYESAAMILLAAGLAYKPPQAHRQGDLFRIFLLSYLAFRLLVDFLKPGVPFFGLTMLQWAAAFALVWYWRDALRLGRRLVARRSEARVHG